jgi:hypothetical protein
MLPTVKSSTALVLSPRALSSTSAASIGLSAPMRSRTLVIVSRSSSLTVGSMSVSERKLSINRRWNAAV